MGKVAFLLLLSRLTNVTQQRKVRIGSIEFQCYWHQNKALRETSRVGVFVWVFVCILSTKQ